MGYPDPRSLRTLRHQGNRLLPSMSDSGSSNQYAGLSGESPSSLFVNPYESSREPGQSGVSRLYTTDSTLYGPTDTLPYHASSLGHAWNPKHHSRPATAPPEHSTNFSRRDNPPPPLREPSPYPKLRRKPSTIGLPSSIATTFHTTPPTDRVLHSPINMVSVQTLLNTTNQSPASPASSRNEPPSPVLSFRPPIHPALRESPCHDRHPSSTPFSYGPCNTPSTRYTASPAFSTVSNQTSATSYSPNLLSTSGIVPSHDLSDARVGPSLPTSPKAFRSPHQPLPSPGIGSLQARRNPALIPELAHLDISSKPQLQPPSRPQRSIGDSIDDYTNDHRSTPIVQSEISPSFAATFGVARPVCKDDTDEPAKSPASSVSKNRFGWGSRPGTSDSRKRKDSAISSLSPTSSRIESPLGLNQPMDFPANLSACPSQTSLTSTTKSRGRFGRLFGRDKTDKDELQVLKKSPRKGPVAGTGHEGYGRFQGFRGRNFSLTSLTNRGRDRSSSRESLNSHTSAHNGLNSWSNGASDTGSEFAPAAGLRDIETTIESEGQLLKNTLVQRGLQSEKHLANQRAHAKESNSLDFVDSAHWDQHRDQAESSGSPKRRNFFQRALARQKGKDITKAQLEEGQKSGEWSGTRLGYYAPDSADSRMDLEEVNDLVITDHGSSTGISEKSLSSISDQPTEESLYSPKRPRSFRLDSSESPQIMHATLAKPTTAPGATEVMAIDNTPRASQISSHRSNTVKRNPLATYTTGDQSDESDKVTIVSSPTGSTTEFLSFPARKDSEISYGSSSGLASAGSSSTLRTGDEDAGGWLGDEDIWNEYNDLIDEVMPVEVSADPRDTTVAPPSPSSSLGAPFYNDETYYLKDGDTKLLPQIHALIKDIEVPEEEEVVDKNGINRFSQFLQPAATPSTPYSLSDIMAGYGDRTASYASTKARQSNTTEARQSMESGYSSLYSRMSGHSRPLSKPEFGDPITPVPEETESEKKVDLAGSPKKSRRSADADLRFGALMTSKWLSFGRVLFSPAHNEVKTGSDVRVLIVDGLGKDWSYYCALTYPNATFYNLEITLSDGKSSTRGQDLSNYKNVRHTSIGSPFPFPRGFFTAVIFRFPVATTEDAYQSCISECKRVLRPGGFLEISVLDLDMMNMGAIGRKELRSLKMDMHSRNNVVSLRNLGDSMLTLVGRRGFENIQRCMVGIPVAGRIPKGEDASSDSSGRSSLGAAMSAHDRGERITTTDFAGILYSQQSDSPTKARHNDEGITKMVAKVGRWWYTTCYGTVAGGDSNIWEQSGLLRECEKQGTAFRLLLCYAQKPTCPPRRTASV